LAELAGLARDHRLSSYDATYLQLAINQKVPLFTRDGDLRRAASNVGVELVAEHNG
jgi:predicted nucleic acid-binding protein